MSDNNLNDYEDFDEAEEKVLNISSIPVKKLPKEVKLTRPDTPKAIGVQKINGGYCITNNS
jgi:hypothetical protein